MKRTVILILAVFICLISFCGATPAVLEPVEIPVADFGGGQFKYISRSSGRICIVTGDTLWSFAEDGSDPTAVNCSGRVRSCLVNGGSVYFISDNGLSFSFEEHSLYGGLIRSVNDIIDPDLYGYVTAMAISGDGNVWLMVKDKELWFCNTGSGEATLAHKFSKSISSLHWVDSGLYAVSGSRVYFCEGTAAVDASSYMELASKPMAFFDGGIYVDYSGNFCSGGSIFFSSPVPDVNAVSHYSDGVNAWYQKENNLVVKTDLYGNVLNEYSTKGLICSVCDKGAITVLDGKLCYAPYDSAPIPTPVPSSTPAGTPEPDAPSEENSKVPSEPVDDREDLPDSSNYISVQAGTKVSSIIKSMKCEIWYRGSKVTSGDLRTGMLAKYGEKELEIVVVGDANGSGTVNSADFKAMQAHLLGTEKLTGAYYLAADISGNGTVGTEDLVLVLKKFS